MQNSQKGFIVPLLIAIVALLVVGGIYIYQTKKAEAPIVLNTEVETINPARETNTKVASQNNQKTISGKIPTPLPSPALNPSTESSSHADNPRTTGMAFDVAPITPFNTRQMPRVMGYSGYYPIACSITDPNDKGSYSVNYGDGVTATMQFRGITHSVESDSCIASWGASSHTFATPGVYTAILYKNGTQIASNKFLVFANDIKTTIPSGASGVGGPTGSAPLTVTFTFTGGTLIDYGDGASEVVCSNNCAQWSNNLYQAQHTYIKHGYYQALVKFNDMGMEAVAINVIAGTTPTITSILPSSASIGAQVTLTGTGFTSPIMQSTGITFYHYENGINDTFSLRNYSVGNNGSSITFIIPSSWSGGSIFPDTYTVFFSDSSGTQSNSVNFTVTN